MKAAPLLCFQRYFQLLLLLSCSYALKARSRRTATVSHRFSALSRESYGICQGQLCKLQWPHLGYLSLLGLLLANVGVGGN